MDKLDRIGNKVFVALMAVLGLVALVAAVMGATHQLLMAAVCGVMVLTLVSEMKKEGKA